MAAGGVAGPEQPLLESFTPKNHSRLRFAGNNVTCLGGTLAELADFIKAGGGQVAAVVTLVNAGRIKRLKPETLVIRLLREKFPDAIQHTFGIDPGALTANEASYLSGFRTADELRNRATKAAEEINLRLRAKGFQLEAQPAPLSQEGGA